MLIGINGFLGSGKDTVYKRVKELYEMSGRDQEVIRISFADKLKLSAAASLGVVPHKSGLSESEVIALVNKIKDEGDFVITAGDTRLVNNGRQWLQWYGTEAHRDVFGDDFWVDQALPLDMTHYGQVVCVTDVRFDNEITRVKENGGMIWHIAGVDDTMSGTHASEKPIDPDLVDVFIDNSIRDDQYRWLDDQIVRALSLRNVIVR